MQIFRGAPAAANIDGLQTTNYTEYCSSVTVVVVVVVLLQGGITVCCRLFFFSSDIKVVAVSKY